MKILHFAKNRIQKPDGSNLTIDYNILSEELKREDGQTVCEGYGVMLCSDKGENADARTLTTSLKEINKLVEVLCKNSVMPPELYDVLDNLLAAI